MRWLDSSRDSIDTTGQTPDYSVVDRHGHLHSSWDHKRSDMIQQLEQQQSVESK